MRLQDRVAIVTGGGVGIGKAYAHGLAKEGAKVVVADIQEAEAQKVATDIKSAGGEAIAVAVDVTSPEKTQAMAEATLKEYGRINISSGTTQSGTPFFLHYVSSKAGVLGFTRALAREVGGDNICVNSIMPGLTISSPNQEGVTSPEQLADRRKRRAIQRDQYPQDLVGTVIFLASDDSDFMTGQAIGVDGGMNMH